MPLTKVQSTTGITTANATSVTATYSGTPTSGNLLVAIASGDDTLTMNNSGWTAGPTVSNYNTLSLWWKIAGAGEPTAIKVNIGSSTGGSLWIGEYSGNVSSAALDKSSTGNPGSFTATCTSGTTATTTQADELAIAGFGWGNYGGDIGTASSYSNSFVQDAQAASTGSGNNIQHVAVATLALAATGAETSTVTISTSVQRPLGLIATFKASAARQSLVFRNRYQCNTQLRM